MEALGINLSVLITQLVSFTVLFLILRKLLFGPISSMLQSRSEKIKESLEAAEKVKNEADESAEKLEKQEDDSFNVVTNKGTIHNAKVVAIAGGLGSFEPRKPAINNIEKFEGKGLELSLIHI